MQSKREIYRIFLDVVEILGLQRSRKDFLLLSKMAVFFVSRLF